MTGEDSTGCARTSTLGCCNTKPRNGVSPSAVGVCGRFDLLSPARASALSSVLLHQQADDHADSAQYQRRGDGDRPSAEASRALGDPRVPGGRTSGGSIGTAPLGMTSVESATVHRPLGRANQASRGAIPVIGVLGHASGDDGVERHRNARIGGARPRRRRGEMGATMFSRLSRENGLSPVNDSYSTHASAYTSTAGVASAR